VLTVVKGRAARKTLELRSERINIGRQTEVSDRDQRLVRRNHLAFDEADDAGATVSRAHAHIRYSATSGEFRLRDDNSAYGTRIVREGRTIEVAPGNSRGVRLRSGDELQFGRAIVRFEI
jgi:pSer/pThr/pTyr-binding forkhead associated (FHA) protein